MKSAKHHFFTSFLLLAMLLALGSCAVHPQDRILDRLEALVIELEQAKPEEDPGILGRIIQGIEELQGQLEDSSGSLDEGRRKRSVQLLERTVKALDSMTSVWLNKIPDQ